MANLNYTKRLSNLQNRKFDRALNESVMSKSLSASLMPDNVKYMLESMRPIEQKYNAKTIEAADRVQKHLESKFQLSFTRAYRTQGSVKTQTNIRVHSDFDLLSIIDSYQYYETSTGSSYSGNPDQDIQNLRSQAVTILKNIYDEVENTNEKCVSIFNKDLYRKVDVVFGFWYNTNEYEKSKNEYYRGIYLYKFPAGPKERDYPFAHIAQVNTKGDQTNDGSRRGIRLLKTLRADSDVELKVVKSFHLTSIVHSINNTNLYYSASRELSIAQAMSNEMDRMISDEAYRKSIKSPNGTENPFFSSSTVPEIVKLKDDLDTLIVDCSKEIMQSPLVKSAVASY